MESSWFYWLELSCQRYWVFIHSSGQLVCGQTSETSWTSTSDTSVNPGGRGEDEAGGSEAPGNSGWKAHASLLSSRANLTPRDTGVPGLQRELLVFFVPEVPIREQEVKSRRLWKLTGEGRRRVPDWQEQTSPDTESSPGGTETHLASSCARDKERRKLF